MTTDDPAFNSADPLCQMSARELAEAYRQQSVSPVEVVRACLARAEEIDPVFNAFSFIDHARALDAAKASENRWANGAPLSEVDGIPATIKDIVWVKDWQVRYGSSVTSDAPATEDAPSVQLMRNAGVIFLGQTTTPEFGWKAVTDSKAFGITRNPRNKDRPQADHPEARPSRRHLAPVSFTWVPMVAGQSEFHRPFAASQG